MRIVSCCVLAACATFAHADVVTVADADFPNATWSHTIHQFGDNGGGGYIDVGASYGLAGRGLAISNTCNAYYSGAWNTALNTAFTYNPALSGELTNLSFSIDTRHVDSLQAVSFAIEQNGNFWRVGYWINASSWQTFAITDVLAADIAAMNNAMPALPDFSASGAPLRFGVTSGNSSAGGWGYSTLGYYDNFSVSFVPAPGAAALLTLAALSAARRRR